VLSCVAAACLPSASPVRGKSLSAEGWKGEEQASNSNTHIFIHSLFTDVRGKREGAAFPFRQAAGPSQGPSARTDTHTRARRCVEGPDWEL